MEYYVGLDVSLKQTSICVVDQARAGRTRGAWSIPILRQYRFT